jgi:hypothetical protein
MHRKCRIFPHSSTQGYPLRDHIDLHHPLVELADMSDWAAIYRVATEQFQPDPGRPSLRPRLVAGLLYLQPAFNLTDEQVIAGWLENPIGRCSPARRICRPSRRSTRQACRAGPIVWTKSAWRNCRRKASRQPSGTR